MTNKVEPETAAPQDRSLARYIDVFETAPWIRMTGGTHSNLSGREFAPHLSVEPISGLGFLKYGYGIAMSVQETQGTNQLTWWIADWLGPRYHAYLSWYEWESEEAKEIRSGRPWL